MPSQEILDAFRDFLLALDSLGRVWRFDVLPPTWTLLSVGPVDDA